MNDSSTANGALLREVARLYTRAQRVVADCCNTTNTQCHILIELGQSGPLAMGELGNRLLLEKSWVGRAIESLIQRGLVNKAPNPNDARSWIVTLSGDGEERVRELNATLDGHATQLLASVAPDEREQMQRSLILLLKVLRSDNSANCCLPVKPAESKPKDSSSCC